MMRDRSSDDENRRGRLSRDVQSKLGETLHAMFDEIVKEGVPDRFSKLLEQINGGTCMAASATRRPIQQGRSS